MLVCCFLSHIISQSINESSSNQGCTLLIILDFFSNCTNLKGLCNFKRIFKYDLLCIYPYCSHIRVITIKAKLPVLHQLSTLLQPRMETTRNNIKVGYNPSNQFPGKYIVAKEISKNKIFRFTFIIIIIIF